MKRTLQVLNDEMIKIIAAKNARRQRLASMTFPEKVRAVIRLQQMAAPILEARGRKKRVWQLESHSDDVHGRAVT